MGFFLDTENGGWKNIKGTSDRSCKCGSWKNHWIKYSGESWPEKCSVKGCNRDATLGAHVRNIYKDITGEYIIPMCDICNKRDTTFSIKQNTVPVPANKNKTCEK